MTAPVPLADMNDQQAITELQRRIGPRPMTLRTRRDYRRAARWWELEAKRGYSSSGDSLRYAANMRWAAELAGLHGDGTWLKLVARAGVENPEARRAKR